MARLHPAHRRPVTSARWPCPARLAGNSVREQLNDSPSKAIDGDAATRWSLGHGMQSGDWFQVDLGSTQTFDQLVPDTSASSGGFVRQYEVYTADDATNWGKSIVSVMRTTRVPSNLAPRRGSCTSRRRTRGTRWASAYPQASSTADTPRTAQETIRARF